MTDWNKASISYEEALIEDFRDDPEFASQYIQTSLEEIDEPGGGAGLATALGQVARAYGVSRIAEESGLNRESLYRALSPKGNPTLKTVQAVLKPLGLRLRVEPITSKSGRPGAR